MVIKEQTGRGERKRVEAVLQEALRSRTGDLRSRLVEQFHWEGYEALAVGREPQPDAPSLVVLEDPHYAVIYLLDRCPMDDPVWKQFRREAQAYARDHDATAYFVLTDEWTVIRGSG